MENITQKKTLMVLDWSNISFRSLSMSSFQSNTPVTYDSDDEINAFIAKLAQDVAYLIKTFNPNKVAFACDSKHSWRKKILSSYKEGRVRDPKVNWTNVFTALDEFRDHLETLGYLVFKCETSEADDLMGLTKELLIDDCDINLMDYNLILVSADADIRQLVSFRNTTSQYCVVFNEIARGPAGKRHIYCDENILNWLENEDAPKNIFNMSVDANKFYLKNIVTQNPKIEFEKINPQDIIMSKVFMGDDGDSVPAFEEHYSPKTGKKVRVTPSKYVKIIDALGAHSIEDVDNKKKQLKPILESVCKRAINDFDVEERLMRQKTLVQLQSSLFPQIIQDYKEEIKNKILNSDSTDHSKVNTKTLITGTRFEQVYTNRKAKEADVFKGLNQYIDNMNLTELF